jgi:hypothetical protein
MAKKFDEIDLHELAKIYGKIGDSSNHGNNQNSDVDHILTPVMMNELTPW